MNCAKPSCTKKAPRPQADSFKDQRASGGGTPSARAAGIRIDNIGGRGHATRVRTVVELLRAEHRFVIFAPGDAFALLAPLYADSAVRVVRIPGVRFAYGANGALAPWRTSLEAMRYAAALPKLVAAHVRAIERERPDLIVTDFEPSLPRAAACRSSASTISIFW